MDYDAPHYQEKETSKRATELVHLNHFVSIGFSKRDTFFKLRLMGFEFHRNTLFKDLQFEHGKIALYHAHGLTTPTIRAKCSSKLSFVAYRIDCCKNLVNLWQYILVDCW